MLQHQLAHLTTCYFIHPLLHGLQLLVSSVGDCVSLTFQGHTKPSTFINTSVKARVEICALLGYNSAYNGNSLTTFRDKL